MRRLFTKAEYANLQPYSQGIVSYAEACIPGSEIPKTNPWPFQSDEWYQWNAGNFDAMLEGVQDFDVEDFEE